jgi:thiosulfate dehydrogenase [quinone] large subunit
MSKESCSTESCCAAKSNQLALIFASLLVRGWLGMRALQTGLEKYATMAPSNAAAKVDGVPNKQGLTEAAMVKTYALKDYHGVPEGLMTQFKTEPLMTEFSLTIYDKVLGPALILLGLSILLGVAYRSSLFLLGLLYISLTWGLILIKKDDGVSWLAAHIILVVMGLALAQYNRLVVTKKW